MKPRFSLHMAKKYTECHYCGDCTPPNGEYWRIKGNGPGNVSRLCVLCHILLGCPTDGWTEAPDGREVMAALVPESR